MVLAETMDLILILPNVGKSVSIMSAFSAAAFSVAGMQLTNKVNANKTINDKGLILFSLKIFILTL